MVNCKLCKEEIKGSALTCCKGTICSKCSSDIFDAEIQPVRSLSDVLWCLAETFFRRAKGEEVSFERVWNEGDNLRLVKFKDLLIR